VIPTNSFVRIDIPSLLQSPGERQMCWWCERVVHTPPGKPVQWNPIVITEF
jgi:hypothetical protein